MLGVVVREEDGFSSKSGFERVAGGFGSASCGAGTRGELGAGAIGFAFGLREPGAGGF